jgi:aryl-alcohol dehydrogenase-like predicted oxidoreductase
MNRRDFVRKAAAAGLGLAGLERASEAFKDPTARERFSIEEEVGTPLRPATAVKRPPSGGLPQRTLGRIDRKISLLGLGMAPLGFGGMTVSEAGAVVNEAIDLGVTYIDVAPNYNDAEAKLGPILRRRRDQVFLVTKVEEQTKEGVLRQIRESLKRMQTDHIDAVHLHNLGDFDLKQTFGSLEGAMAGLKAARQAGYLRYFGISGHMRPWKFVEALKTGEIDLVMVALNFVDRFTYNFEETVLPEARKQRAAIAAMKVLGGARRMQYSPPQPAELADHYRDAVRYALGLSGVSTLVIGVKNREELYQAVATLRTATPLTVDEEKRVLDLGRQTARRWGAHFGPVT